jgi:uncharacterized protein
MKDARFTSWRYFLPTADHRGAIGITVSGAVELVADDLALRQSILLLLATVPGERVMRPEYGCDLERFVFAPNDDTTAGLAIQTVRSAVERWEPRIEILGLDARRDPDDAAKLVITVTYRGRFTGGIDTVSVATPVGG